MISLTLCSNFLIWFLSALPPWASSSSSFTSRSLTWRSADKRPLSALARRSWVCCSSCWTRADCKHKVATFSMFSISSCFTPLTQLTTTGKCKVAWFFVVTWSWPCKHACYGVKLSLAWPCHFIYKLCASVTCSFQEGSWAAWASCPTSQVSSPSETWFAGASEVGHFRYVLCLCGVLNEAQSLWTNVIIHFRSGWPKLLCVVINKSS